MSDCLHCDINELVQKHMEREGADLAELAARMTESLADLILLAPETDQSNLKRAGSSRRIPARGIDGLGRRN